MVKDGEEIQTKVHFILKPTVSPGPQSVFPEKFGVCKSMRGSPILIIKIHALMQRVGHDLVTEQQQCVYKILPSFLTSSHTRLLIQAPASLPLCIPQKHKACPPSPGPLHLLPAATRALFFPGLPKAGIFLSFKLSSNTNEGKAIP